MKTRTLHKIAGIILLLPFLAWSATGVFFLVRPAYAQAYAPLELRTYPLERPFSLAAHADWLELRYLRSILGEHLLVRRAGGWTQLDPLTLQERAVPDAASLRRLVTDAIGVNAARFGSIAMLEGSHVVTDTGVEIELDWNTLAFTQEGRDTRWIDRVYRIHYLEWTGIAVIDKILGLCGLLLLMFMTWTGAQLAFGWGRRRADMLPALTAAQESR